MANIRGLSFDYHHAAAALLIDGQLVAAIQEERLPKLYLSQQSDDISSRKHAQPFHYTLR